MCDFDSLEDAVKERYHKQLVECADAFGGKNFFLQLIEAIRKNKQSPLIAKECEFRFALGGIKWNKIIFEDKLILLNKVRVDKSEDGNLLPKKKEKSFKKKVNLVRTLKPVVFEVKPKNMKDGSGFTLHPFDVIDDTTTRLNPIFDALFFCPINRVKKALSYKVKP